MKFCAIIIVSAFITSAASGQFRLLKDVNPGTNWNNGLFFKKLKPGMWIASWDGGPTLGQELWKTDGSAAGTTVIKDIYPGAGWGTGYNSDPHGDILNGELYIACTHNGTDLGLYKTDGSAAGTVPVNTQIVPYAITNINNTLFMGGRTNASGIELYKSNGTAAGTEMIKDINPGPGHGLNPGHSEVFFVQANGYVFFRANDGVHGYELWRTDGTAAGTQMVKDIFQGSGNGLSDNYRYVSTLQYLIEWNGFLYFVAQSGTGKEELWRTDGTEAGTTKVTQLNGTGFRPFASQLTVMGDRLYFLYKLNNDSTNLFSTDGTTTGTQPVLSKNFLLASEYIAQGVTLLYFTSFSPETGMELWRSDGTAAGTFMVKDLNPGAEYGMYTLAPGTCFINWDEIYFSANNGNTGGELFHSNGSLGNATLVYDAIPGINGSSPGAFYNFQNRLMGSFLIAPYGYEAWISDSAFLFPDLLSFTASASGVDAILKWSTANEENSSYFEVERSTNGTNFSYLATVQGSGTNVLTGRYTYTDPSLPQGTYYYRIKFFKTAGNFRYSNIARVQITEVAPANNNNNLFIIYPNPVSEGKLYLKLGIVGTGNAELVITDISGKMIQKKPFVITGWGQTVSIGLKGTSRGTYVVSLFMNNKKLKSESFIVQ